MVSSQEWKAQTVNFYFQVFFGRGLAKSESDYYLAAAKTFVAAEHRSERKSFSVLVEKAIEKWPL